jgi:hypothetical protein
VTLESAALGRLDAHLTLEPLLVSRAALITGGVGTVCRVEFASGDDLVRLR